VKQYALRSDIAIEKVKNKPPTWLLSKYQVGTDGRISKVDGLLIKSGTERHAWTLEVGNLRCLCKSRRKAIDVFRDEEFIRESKDKREGNL
jgi:hypothetical protein